MGTRDLIHVYKDGNQWCAIYPMGSNLMDCQAVAFNNKNVQFSTYINRERDYGRYQALDKLRKENPEITRSYYCEYHD